MNDSLVEKPAIDVVRKCAHWEHFCETEIIIIQGSFTSVSRSCSSHCNPACESVGYGQDRVSCSACCTTSKCNNKFSMDFYSQIASKQFTSWTEPVVGEKEYNKKNGLIFPY
uniref:Snake toxin/toxin-like domain-containing protein n=1 Tax=Acrobeloides nanus TaxID=290746 RepID=A0A914DLS4_9BILA